MDEFPRMLYRFPGPEPLQNGNFSTLIVRDSDEQAQALAAGWHLTTPAAKEAHEAPPPAAPAEPEDAGPTRAELEQKATELGVSFDGRTSDKKLGEKIAAALKG